MRFFLLLCASAALFAQSPALNVTQGSASRNPAAGAIAHVWADPNTATQVFDGWAGDTQYLLDPAGWHTTLIMPNAPVNLRATYRTVPAWTARTGMLGGVNVTYTIPANPIGLIFVFHGTGGTGAEQFSVTEFLSFIREAVADGFAVAAFDSTDRTTAITGSANPGIWNTTMTNAMNPDIVHLNNVLAAMRSQALIPAQLPLFAFGHSNGATFAQFSAPFMNWTAVSLSCSFGSSYGNPLYGGPVLWQIAQNDDHPLVGAKGNAEALTSYEAHANRRQPARMVTWQPEPIYPARFARAATISLADSQLVYNLFRTNGWVDANDMQTQNPETFNWKSALPSRFTTTMHDSIMAQLRVAYTGHFYSSETSHVTRDLFLRAMGRRPALMPVSGASFAGPNLAPEFIGTLFAGALAPNLQVAASGPQANLGGATATLRDNANAENPVSWFFVSPGQGSFLTPGGMANGAAVLKVVSGSRRWAIPTNIARSAPGIFSANGDGQGAPAADILRVTAENKRTPELPFAPDPATGRFVSNPIVFGSDRLFLNLYATGVRLADPASIQVLVGDQTIAPLFAGAQPQFVGLDQITLELPPALAGQGRVSAVIVADGVRSNSVDLLFP